MSDQNTELQLPLNLTDESRYNDPAGLIELANNYNASIINTIKKEIEEQYPLWLEGMIANAKMGQYSTTITFTSKVANGLISTTEIFNLIDEYFHFYNNGAPSNGWYKITYVTASSIQQQSLYIISRIEWLPKTFGPGYLENEWNASWSDIVEKAIANKENQAKLTFNLLTTYSYHPNYPIQILVNYLADWLLETKKIKLTNYNFIELPGEAGEEDDIIKLDFYVSLNNETNFETIDSSPSKQLQDLREKYKQNLYDSFEDIYDNVWNDNLILIAEKQGLNFIDLSYQDENELIINDYKEIYLNNMQLLLQDWWRKKDPDFIFTSLPEDIDYENRIIKFKISWNK